MSVSAQQPAADPPTSPYRLLSGHKEQGKGDSHLALLNEQQKDRPRPSRPSSAAHTARQHVAAKLSQPTSRQRRPATAAAHGRPYSAVATYPDDETSCAAAATKASRCSSARAPTRSVHQAAMARLKAELAGLASVGNVQLQSLKPRPPLDASPQKIDACAELEAKVLDQLQLLQQQTDLTYSQARHQAISRTAVDNCSKPVGAVAAGQLSCSAPTTDYHGQYQAAAFCSPAAGTGVAVDGKQPSSTCAWQLQDPLEYDEKAARAELEAMRDWVAEQDLRFTEPSIAARFKNKAVAARISQLQSHTQVLKFQRQFYESALAELQAHPMYGSCAPWKQQRKAALIAAFEAEAAEGSGTAMEAPPSPGKSPKSPKKHRVDCDHSLPGCTIWSATPVVAQRQPGSSQFACGFGQNHGLRSSCSLSDHSSSNSSTDNDERSCSTDVSSPCSRSSSRHQQQQDLSGDDEEVSEPPYVQLEPQSRHRKHLSLVKAAAVTAAEEAEEAGIRQKGGYTGGAAAAGMANLRRCISRSSDVLQMSHSGLQPHQLDKVATALMEAPWIKALDLSGNLLTDRAVADLASLLLSIPSAAAVTHLDLSQNQVLTWRCCAALMALLMSPPAQQPSQPSSSRSAASADDSSGSTSQKQSNSPSLYTAEDSNALNNPDTFFAGGSAMAPAAVPAVPQAQYFQLASLSLEGVTLGDKGAAALAAALATNRTLQVLHLARCRLRDAGGAAICSAVWQHCSLCKLDLGWNALGHNTARAVEAALRCPTCPISWLSLTHCGLDDRDGARILDALTPAACRLSYSSSCGASVSRSSSTSKDGCPLRSNWHMLDLSYNSLEGGAALVAAAVITAFAADATSGSSTTDNQQSLLRQHDATGSQKSLSVRRSSSGGSSGTQGGLNCRQSSDSACRTLLLDGNPLGVSGVCCIARALAGQPSVGAVAASDSSRSTSDGLDASAPDLSSYSTQIELEAEASLALMSTDDHHHHQQQQYRQQQLGRESKWQPRLQVGVAKVTLVAKEKGVRASLRDSHASVVTATQVPTLFDVLETPDTAKGKVPESRSSSKGARDSDSPAKASKGTKSPRKAPSALAAPESSKAGLLMITETAAGFNLTCPGGQYSLHLTHPAVRHLVQELLELRVRLQLMQQQVKELQQQQLQQQQQQQHLLTAAANAELSQSNRRASNAGPMGGRMPEGGGGASTAPSRRVTRTGSTAGATAASGASAVAASRPSTAATRQFRRRILSCPVEPPALLDVKLDGKLVKLEQVLELQPWYKPPPAGTTSTDGGSLGMQDGSSAAAGSGTVAGVAGEVAADAGQLSGAVSGAGGRKKGKKHFKQLTFTVKAAAVLAGHEPLVMPLQLQQWAMQAMSGPSVSDVWRMQLLELLLADWLLTPQQAVELLGLFDKELGQEEKLSAAGLMWARLVQPMDFWDRVLPVALKPQHHQRFKDMLGPQLMSFDRQNLTGSYTLNLSWSVHKAVAQRLQSAALQDNATSECRYYLCWRNTTLNGIAVRDAAIAQLQNYAIPPSGILKLDYVSYQVPGPGCPPAHADQLRQLLGGLRALQASYYRKLLSLREEYLPGGLRRSQEEEKAAAAQARLVSTKRPIKGAPATSIAPKSVEAMQQAAAAEDPICSDIHSSQQPQQQQQQEQEQEPGQPIPWWKASGVEPSALLLKYSHKLSTAAAGATGCAQGNKWSTTGGGVESAGPSRRVTRERPSSAAKVLKSRPSSAATASRPTSAAASRPSSATGTASKPLGVSDRRATRSKAPRASQLTASGCSALAGGRTAVTDEELLARLLAAAAPDEVAAVFATLTEAHAAAVMGLLAGMAAGAAAVAALLECLSPVVAVRYLTDVSSHAGVLPAAVRAQVVPLLKPAVADAIKEVAVAVAEAAAIRSNQQLLLIRQFAAKTSGVSCSQLVEILRLLAVQGQAQRCGVVVALWSRVVDRSSLVEVFEGLSGGEQLGLMSALGSYHVWSTLSKPDGLHFRLDLTQPEQRDVAREVVKVAVRRSLSERAASGARVQHLQHFTAEGKPVVDPEDDKLWLSMESKHTLLEFDFAKTWEQELHLMVGAVKRIQRAWRKRDMQRQTVSFSGTAGKGSAASSRPPTPESLVAGFTGPEQLEGRGFTRSGLSGYSSELSSGYSSYLTGATSSTLYSATTGSSMLSSPLSLSSYMSEVPSFTDQQQQQQMMMVGGSSPLVGTQHAAGATYTAGETAGSFFVPTTTAPQQSQLAASAATGPVVESLDFGTGLLSNQAAQGQGADTAKPTPRLF